MGFVSSIPLGGNSCKWPPSAVQKLLKVVRVVMKMSPAPRSDCARPKVLVLAGPTCVGKSAIAMQTSSILPRPVEIVSADSVQVYRGLDIGSNKPSRAERSTVNHHLIDIVSPSTSFTAGQFFRRAREAVDIVLARSNIPLVVGGTMMYIRWFIYGRPATPRPDEDDVKRVNERVASFHNDWDAAIAYLATKDPGRASKLIRNDWYRLKRSLQIVESTKGLGVSNVPLQGGAPQAPERQKVSRKDLDFDFRCVFLYNDRVPLNRRIDERCERMMLSKDGDEPAGDTAINARAQVGISAAEYVSHSRALRSISSGSMVQCEGCGSILTEVASLLNSRALPVTDSSPARAIGYRQTIRYLVHRASKVQCRSCQRRVEPTTVTTEDGSELGEDAISDFREYLEEFQQATRAYAKQQMSWFRREREFLWVRADESAPDMIRFLFNLDEEDFNDYVRENIEAQDAARREMIEQGKLMKTYISSPCILVRGSRAEAETVKLAETLATQIAQTLSNEELETLLSQTSSCDSANR